MLCVVQVSVVCVLDAVVFGEVWLVWVVMRNGVANVAVCRPRKCV